MKAAWVKLAFVVLVGVVIALIPPPAGLPVYAWQYFALFAAVLVGLEPVPAAAVGLIGPGSTPSASSAGSRRRQPTPSAACPPWS